MKVNERFEYMAELFYRETGMTAPGKDNCAAFGCRSEEEEAETAKQWRAFAERFYGELFDLHQSNANCAENN